MKYSLLIASFLLLCPLSNLFAQSGFKEGFVVTQANDTLYGQIEYQTGASSYASCRFKKGDNSTDYTPDQLKGYGYANSQYFTSGIQEGSFVEVLVAGKLSLYKWGKVYFVRKDQGELYRIEAKQEEIVKDGIVRIKKDNAWKNILSYLLSDCLENSHTLLQNMDVHEKHLTRLSVRYNKCQQVPYTEYKADEQWVSFELGGSLGMARATITMEDTEGYMGTPFLTKRYTTTYPEVGLVGILSFPRSSRNIAMQSELLFSKSSYSGQARHQGVGYSENHQSQIDLTTLSIPISLKWRQAQQKYSFDAQAGVNYDFLLDSDTRLQREKVTQDAVQQFPEVDLFKVKDSQMGAWGGIGLTRSFTHLRAGISLRYYKMSVLNVTSGIWANSSRFALNLIVTAK